MAPGVGFSVPVFVALFREATEAAIVVSVLLSFINRAFATPPQSPSSSSSSSSAATAAQASSDYNQSKAAVAAALRKSVWLGTIAGLVLALTIAVIFMVFWFVYSSNLW